MTVNLSMGKNWNLRQREKASFSVFFRRKGFFSLFFNRYQEIQEENAVLIRDFSKGISFAEKGCHYRDRAMIEI